jgi:periplasmic mercuric ion binding protein
MKCLKLLLGCLFLLAGPVVFAQQKTDKIKVYGNCSMCQSRIQKALKVDGVSAAKWNEDTKMLSVTYNPSKITTDAIQKRVATVGHDTEKYEAAAKDYAKLPSCCHYDRRNGGAPNAQHH